MKCINCKLVEVTDGTQHCSLKCLTEYMIKDVIMIALGKGTK